MASNGMNMSDFWKDSKPLQNEQKIQKADKVPPVSVWLPEDTRRRLKALSTASGLSVSKLVSIASEDLIQAYEGKLTKDQKTIYKAALRMYSK